ncbi:hypothetical protein [Limibacillus halophilus]|uniref:Uncharacterized protein n=1 Tax=Limibacillus halophilus TaxID=1579333 RepID=A0A839SUS5_9PROT|nr:hypothetical protein [Limibacillus halophilus]MBB3065769.1 hypothetical protein [Limibacillus halophilus]
MSDSHHTPEHNSDGQSKAASSKKTRRPVAKATSKGRYNSGEYNSETGLRVSHDLPEVLPVTGEEIEMLSGFFDSLLVSSLEN